MLTEVMEVLQKIDENTFYGAVDSRMKETAWNYIVFDRGTFTRSETRASYSETVNVHVVRENFIPEGLAEQVIEEVESLKGFRLVKGEHEYTYSVKPGTNAVVEMLSLEFVRARKRLANE